MIGKNYLVALFCLTSCMFYDLFSSQQHPKQQSITFPHNDEDNSQQRFDFMPTDPRFRQEEYDRALQQSAERGASQFIDLQPLVQQHTAAIEAAMEDYLNVSKSEQRMLQKQTSMDNQFNQDQQWLARIITEKNAALKQSLQELTAPNSPVRIDNDGINIFTEMLNLSVAGKILAYLEKINERFYSQLPLQKYRLVGLTPKGRDVMLSEFDPSELNHWKFKLIPLISQ